MKRYLVFFGSDYYPEGGIDDLFGEFATFEESKNAIEEEIMKDFNPDLYDSIEDYLKKEWEYKWAHIYDTEKKEKVWEK